MLIPWPHGAAQASPTPRHRTDLPQDECDETDCGIDVEGSKTSSPFASSGGDPIDKHHRTSGAATYDWIPSPRSRPPPVVKSQPPCPAGRDEDEGGAAHRNRGRGRVRGAAAGKSGGGARPKLPLRVVGRPMTSPPGAASCPGGPASASPRTPTERSPSLSAAAAASNLQVSVPKAASGGVIAARHPGVSALAAATPSARGRRWGGLVRRTHSPKTVQSPLSRPVQLSSLGGGKYPGVGAPPLTTDTDTRLPLPVFPHAVSTNKKKRRRSNNNGGSSTTTFGKSGGKASRAVFVPLKKKQRRRTRSKSPPGGGRRRRSSPAPPPSSSRAPKTTNSNDGHDGGERASTATVTTTTSTKVRTVSPTVRGIHEAARVLLRGASTTTETKRSPPLSSPRPANSKENPRTSRPLPNPTTGSSSRGGAVDGILSFPTETVYALATCVRVRQGPRRSAASTRSGSTSSSSSSASSSSSDCYSSDGNATESGGQTYHGRQSLTQLLQLKGRTDEASPPPTHMHTIGSDAHDPPLVYLHSPSQHRDLVKFTKPKTFVIKKKKPREGGREKIPAVTFSESREVLDRLSVAFWPGPVVIYAPAKMRKVGPRDEEESGYAPILPPSALVGVPPECGDADGVEVRSYVGMRCPSHPLARRLLEEVYDRSGGGGGRRGRCSSAVVGFAASVAPHQRSSSPHGLTKAARAPPPRPPITAREVCAQLLSAPHGGTGQEGQSSPATVHVLNGEDRREVFSHATCEFGAGGASESLLIDDEARIVHILRSRGAGNKDDEEQEHGRRNSPRRVHPVDVMRALLKPSSPPLSLLSEGEDEEESSAAAGRVITAVLQRWRVVEVVEGGTVEKYM